MTVPPIDREDIRKQVGDSSLARGFLYFQRRTIVDTRRRGSTLEARCWGTRDDAYRVKVQFGVSGIVGATCSCPVGAKGSCKHVAALLFAWLNHPDEFGEAVEAE